MRVIICGDPETEKRLMEMMVAMDRLRDAFRDVALVVVQSKTTTRENVQRAVNLSDAMIEMAEIITRGSWADEIKNASPRDRQNEWWRSVYTTRNQNNFYRANGVRCSHIYRQPRFTTKKVVADMRTNGRD